MKKRNEETSTDVETLLTLYKQAVETYRHYHTFVVTAGLVIAAILSAFLGLGIARLMIGLNPSPKIYLVLSLTLVALISLLLFIIIKVFIYIETASDNARGVAKNIEKKLNLDEDLRLIKIIDKTEHAKNIIFKITEKLQNNFTLGLVLTAVAMFAFLILMIMYCLDSQLSLGELFSLVLSH